MSGWGLVRIKRRWVPEWLWYFSCNPIPFWNDSIAQTWPGLRVWLGPLTHLLSEPCNEFGEPTHD